jgi:hypothetical protein
MPAPRRKYLGNICLDPFQQKLLVEEPGIQISILSDFLACQEPIRPNSVVEVDKYDTVPRNVNYSRTIIVGICIGGIPATLNVNPDGEL